MTILLKISRKLSYDNTTDNLKIRLWAHVIVFGINQELFNIEYLIFW